jgi:hypothetical protein
MGLFDLATSLTPGRRRKRASRPGAPRTIVPVDGALGERAATLAAPRGATAPAGPLDVARIDAARERLRREIAPVSDDEL